MTPVLVDTCVFSYIHKGDSRAADYRKHLDRRVLCLGLVSVAELYRWALARSWGPERTGALRNAIAAYRVLAPNDLVAWKWAELMVSKGRPMNSSDAWIAATALVFGMPLVTHDRGGFEHISGLELLSERSEKTP